jgi:hypothetical protein
VKSVRSHTSARSAAETPDQAASDRRAIDRLDIAAGLLHYWWGVVSIWVAVTIWVAWAIGS